MCALRRYSGRLLAPLMALLAACVPLAPQPSCSRAATYREFCRCACKRRLTG
jgi:hypothetical protein